MKIMLNISTGQRFWRIIFDMSLVLGVDAGGHLAADEAASRESPARESPVRRWAVGVGRVSEAGEVVDRIAATVQSRPPLALAELAPLVSRAATEGDPAALSIVAAAATRLLRTVTEVRGPGERSPIVLAGSVLTTEGPVRRAVPAQLEQRWTAAAVSVAGDGAGAAAWLAALDLHGPARAAPLHSRFVG